MVFDEFTRERIDFVTDDEISAGYFLERFDAADLYTTLGGTRDATELQNKILPGFWLQPGTNVEPELIYDWRVKPLPAEIERLRRAAQAEGR